jgi:hypothetical protein
VSAQQGTHFWLMTIQKAVSGGIRYLDAQGTWTPGPAETRMDAFNSIRLDVEMRDPRIQGGVVLAFDIQPNQL